MIQLKERYREIRDSNDKFNYLERTKMYYELLCCAYYSIRARKTTNELMRQGYDAMFLSHWVTHKKIFYKPTK